MLGKPGRIPTLQSDSMMPHEAAPPLALRSVNREERLSSAVNDVFIAVRDGILRGTLAPGQTITEIEIGKLLGVSRTPAREALRELEAQGLLIRRHRRLIVATLSESEAEDLHELRLALEPLALRQAMSRGDVDSVTVKLERTVSELRFEIKSKEMTAALASARNFHEAIYQASGNEMLIRFLVQVYNRVDQYRFYSNQMSYRRLRSTADEHLEIVNAMRRGEFSAAEAAMKRHLGASHDFDTDGNGRPEASQ
jgi:DNA-binding GntR family transcriptional regulator